MSGIYIIFSCLIAAETVHAVQQNLAASTIVDLYNKTLYFFDDFLSPDRIDSLPRFGENIPYETLATLHNAWRPYSSLYSKIMIWCIDVNSTSNMLEQELWLYPKRQEELASDVIRELNKMKGYFDSIATNSVNYQAMITFTDGVLKYEVINGHTSDEIEDMVEPLLQRSKSEGNVTLVMFNGNVNHAKIILTTALSVLNGTTSAGIFDKEDIEDMVAKCRPFLIESKIPSRSEFPPPTITPSKKDILMRFSSDSCLWFPDECVVILSKQTVAQLRDFYENDQSVNDFFNAINDLSSSAECKDRMKSYIKNNYFFWGFGISKMKDKQFMKISICLKPDKSDIAFKFGHVTIVN